MDFSSNFEFFVFEEAVGKQCHYNDCCDSRMCINSNCAPKGINKNKLYKF